MSHRPMPLDTLEPTISRRRFLERSAVGGSLAAGLATGVASATEPATDGVAEDLVRQLHDSLSPQQRSRICLPWDYRHPKFGLLRTRVANNWQCTDTDLSSDFFTEDQRKLTRAVFERLTNPAWHDRFDRQLEDDTGGFGHQQSIAILGTPGDGPYQFLLTGRHMTLRCDGDSAEHVAFGGPIFYGHDAGGFNEEKDHPGNVFWPQAMAANGVFEMLDGRQRKQALAGRPPAENAIAFRGPAVASVPTGIAVSELSDDQQQELVKVLGLLLEPFRRSDRSEAKACLARQGGLEACRLTFYKGGDIGNDGVWDNWRLEGPSFVWHFRGAPHVHVWVNIADDPSVVTNA